MVVQELFRVFREGCGKWSYAVVVRWLMYNGSAAVVTGFRKSCGMDVERLCNITLNGCVRVVHKGRPRLCAPPANVSLARAEDVMKRWKWGGFVEFSWGPGDDGFALECVCMCTKVLLKCREGGEGKGLRTGG